MKQPTEGRKAGQSALYKTADAQPALSPSLPFLDGHPIVGDIVV
jgi:hypothetical protein